MKMLVEKSFNRFKDFITQKQKILRICLYSLLTISLLFTCFYEIGVYFSLAILFLALIFGTTNDVVCLYLFYSNFNDIILFKGSEYIVGFALIFALGIRFLIKLIKKQSKIHILQLVLGIIFAIFIAIPFYRTPSLYKLFGYYLFIAVTYLVFELKDDLSIKKIIKVYTLGLLISSFMALLRPISPRLQSCMGYVVTWGYLRFTGFLGHPNPYICRAVIALGGLLVLKYYKKINNCEFFGLLLPLFIFSYMTLSRMFIISFAASLIIFAILYFVKYKKKAFKLILSMAGCFLVICGAFTIETKIYLFRANILPFSSISDFYYSSTAGDTIFEQGKDNESLSESEAEEGSEEWWQQVFDGEIRYDNGRVEYWKLNLKDWSSSAVTILFGKGVDAPNIGRAHAHNVIISELRKLGIFGLTLLLCYIVSLFKGKNKFKEFLIILIFIAPYLICDMLESNLSYVFIITAVLFYFEIEKEKKKADEKLKVKTTENYDGEEKINCLYYNPTLNLGGTEVYMVNLIENMDKQKFKYDVLIKSKENISESLLKRLNEAGAKVIFLEGHGAKQLYNIAKFFSDNNGHYDVMHINSTGGSVGIFAYFGKDFGGIENVIFHSHMGGVDYAQTFKNKLKSNVGMFLAKNFSDSLVACSRLAGNFMFGEKYCSKHNVMVLNNSINIDKFKFNKDIREEYRKNLKLSDKFVIFNIGRFAQQKNHIRLVEVFAEVLKKDKKAVLVIVGNGPLFAEVEAKIKELKVESSVMLLGERDDVSKLMQAADVFVMTSIHEGLPIVAVETQTSGLPLVLSDAITTDTNITGNCKFVSLDADNKVWAEEVLNCKKFKRGDETEKIISHNFDNASAAKIIENLYLGN